MVDYLAAPAACALCEFRGFLECLDSVLEGFLVRIVDSVFCLVRVFAPALPCELLLGALAGPVGLVCQLVEAAGNLGRVVDPEYQERLLAFVVELVLQCFSVEFPVDDFLDRLELG